jgi:hypothetical protein
VSFLLQRALCAVSTKGKKERLRRLDLPGASELALGYSSVLAGLVSNFVTGEGPDSLPLLIVSGRVPAESAFPIMNKAKHSDQRQPDA